MQLMVESEPEQSIFWYLSNVMDKIDKSKIQDYHLVTDNAPVPTPAKVRALVEGRHYRYLLP
jgi:hypothetical protein